MLSIIFTCIGMSYEMKGNNYENIKMILREIYYCIQLNIENKR